MHCKSVAAQEVRALLTARKLVQSKLYDIEMSLRGILRGFGLKVGPTTSQSFAARINHLVDGQTSLEVVAAALLSLHAVALREFKSLEKSVRQRLLMSTPGVGPAGGADLCGGDRRSGALHLIKVGGGTFWAHSEKVSPVQRGRLPDVRNFKRRFDLEGYSRRVFLTALRSLSGS